MKSGKVLGIDTLEIFDADVSTLGMPEGVADSFPHTAIVIDWNSSAGSQTPCIGDSVIVTNLSPRFDAEEPLEYSYDELIFIGEVPSNIESIGIDRLSGRKPPGNDCSER